VLMIAVVVILAIVGIFVMIYIGSKFVNQVIRTHMKVLQKRGLAEDFIVADLDESVDSCAVAVPKPDSPSLYNSLSTQDDGNSYDLELGNIINSESAGRSTKSNISEAQEQELMRLGLICSDDEMRENASALTHHRGDLRSSSIPNSSLIQRRNR